MNDLLDWLRIDHHMLILILLIGTVFTYVWFLKFKERLRFSALTALPAAVIHTLFGVLCVTSFAVIETMNPHKFGNLSIFGATFFMPILFFLFAKIGKRDMTEVFDIGCVSMMFTLMCSRFNCLVCGCCTGLPFFHSSDFRWPTRELEILFYIVLITVFVIKLKNNKSEGTNYPIYMIAYGAFRFCIEWVRTYDSNSFIHRAHIWAVISLFIGISVLSEMKSRRRKMIT